MGVFYVKACLHLCVVIPLSFTSQLGEHGHLLPVERAVPQDGQELRPLRLHLRPQRGPKGGIKVSQRCTVTVQM